MNEQNRIYLLLAMYSLAAILTICFFDGTGDAGDSIHHYLIAKFAPNYPYLYFDHWAKPVFVLFASPFAQFGFTGMKVFNAVASLLTIYYTYLSARALGLNHSLLAGIIVIFCPLNFVLTFSGLTEPLFALFLSIGLYLALTDRSLLSAAIVSFLPFVRSEGLILVAVFCFFFLLKRQWKCIPMLLLGHVAYSLAGYTVHRDLLWVFKKIPYSSLDSIYGSGKWSHFVEHLYYVVGAPIYILLCIGILGICIKSLKRQMGLEVPVLLLLGFAAFFAAHTMFWYLGIFKSMGLIRVFIAVVPLMALIALIGFNVVIDELLRKSGYLRSIVKASILGYIVLFPFTPNPAAIDWNKDLNLTKDQLCALEVGSFLKSDALPAQRYAFAHPYLSHVLELDHFDQDQRIGLTPATLNHLKKGDIVIWEKWYAGFEHGVPKEALENHPGFTRIYKLSEWEDGYEHLYLVYSKN